MGRRWGAVLLAVMVSSQPLLVCCHRAHATVFGVPGGASEEPEVPCIPAPDECCPEDFPPRSPESSFGPGNGPGNGPGPGNPETPILRMPGNNLTSPGGGGRNIGTPAKTGNPVHLQRGAVIERTVDLTLSGPSFNWSHRRSYDSGTPVSTTGRSTSWIGDESFPRLSALGGDEVILSQSATNTRTFEGSAASRDSQICYDATMT